MDRTDMHSAHWYALEVRPRPSAPIPDQLRQKGLDVFNPTYTEHRPWADRIGTVTKPLFPGYLFARFPLERRMPVLMTPGVKQILGIGKQPVPVPDEELASVRAMVDSRLPLQSCEFLMAGTRVIAVRGPLAGARGVLVRHCGTSLRVVVSIELIQRSISAEVDQSWIEPADDTALELRRAQAWPAAPAF